MSNATVTFYIDLYNTANNQWIRVFSRAKNRAAATTVGFTYNFYVDTDKRVAANQIRFGYTSTDNEVHGTYNATIYGV